jgi:16S rRNA (cytosine1402-N4)-methyltransferase
MSLLVSKHILADGFLSKSLLFSRHIRRLSIGLKACADALIESNIHSGYHVPVMLKTTIDLLDCKPGSLMVDCTLGGGGHSAEMLSRGARVIAIDQDDDAIREAGRRLNDSFKENKLEIVKSNFRNIEDVVNQSSLAMGSPPDGILLDLGISSHQIDQPERGFSFQLDGPIDMRMDYSSNVVGASEIVNLWSQSNLADLLFNYGDETNSRAIAREIVASRPHKTTRDLVNAISKVTPSKFRQKTMARCFQALRIFINDELGALEEVLAASLRILRPGGRLVVLSYHSLEDRKVKLAFQNKFEQVLTESNVGIVNKMADNHYFNHKSRPFPDRFKPPCEVESLFEWSALSKKAIMPSQDEIRQNSRSRSAKLRGAMKTSRQHGR